MENIKKRETKKKLGQFYTTNSNYILNNLYIPELDSNIKIIEPFVGKGDLLQFIFNNIKNHNKILCYDICNKSIEYNIDKKYDIDLEYDIQIQFECINSLIDDCNLSNNFIITNPPYLSRNKNTDKTIYNMFNENDLYKCFIRLLINNKTHGGILILPLNFFCSIRQSDIDLRKDFLNLYDIVKLNIFEEKIFEDTSYNICSFQYIQKSFNLNYIEYIPTNVLCNGKIVKTIDFILNENNNYTFGGDIYKYNLNNSTNVKITRLTKNNKTERYSNIFVKCIDDNQNSKIRFEYNETPYIDETPNLSCRTFATLIITPYIDNEKQKKLIKLCNEYLEFNRDKYYSLFLTNYRETKGNFMRKRISFDLVYNIVLNVIEQSNFIN